MPLLQDFQLQTASFDIAIVAATISILLGGILFGAGLGLGLRRIRLLGLEETGQGIISAAMVGALVAFVALLDATTASLAPSSSLPACPSVQDPSGSPFSFYACHLQSLSASFSHLSSQLSRSSDIAGFAGTLTVSAGVVTSQPFYSLQAASQSLSAASAAAARDSALAQSELQLADSVRASALAIFLPAGLLLRTFFATRKLGAAAMAIAISAYVVYPLVFLYTFTISKAGASASQAADAASSFNSQFAALPLLDLDEAGGVKDRIAQMAEGDFPSRLQPLLSLSYNAVSLAQSDLLVYPLLSLIVSAVAAAELYSILSAQLFLPGFEVV